MGAWPFTTPASAPTSFAGPGAVVPTAATEIGGGTALTLLGADFYNASTDTVRTVTITNTAGVVVDKIPIQPRSPATPRDWTFRPSLGLKWSVDDAGAGDVIGHVWGY
jgi:hypothetical protein